MAAEYRGDELEAVTILFLTLSLVAVGLRCYVRAVMLRSFGSDDWFAVATMITFAIFCGFVLQAIDSGAGRRLNAVSFEDISGVLKCRWFGEFFYVITSVLVKYTVGIFLLRIITSRWQKVLIWLVLGVMLVFNIFYLFIVIFQCSPPQHFWLRILGTHKGTCLAKPLISNTAYVGSAINAWADWMLGLLPIAMVWKLSLRPKDKLLLAFILGLGSVACTATVVRMFYVWQLTDAEDFLYEFVDIAIWSVVENGLGLTASSLATLRPLVRKFRSLYHRTDEDTESMQMGIIQRTPPAFLNSPSSLPIDGLRSLAQEGRPRDIEVESGCSSIKQ